MSPLDKEDNPDLDDTNLLGPDDIKIYQSLIGSLQWCVSLGRLDVATAVMTLSSFRVAPRIGHLAAKSQAHQRAAKKFSAEMSRE